MQSKQLCLFEIGVPDNQPSLSIQELPQVWETFYPYFDSFPSGTGHWLHVKGLSTKVTGVGGGAKIYQ
jgi:hypothetical protein